MVVVGAGASGLTLAYQYLKAGKSVVLIERNDYVGGLAKSHHYDGHTFDTGPKRFHTEDPAVLEFLDEIDPGLCVIPRDSKVHFLGRYLSWPLQPADLIRLPPVTAAQCFFDLLKRQVPRDPDSFVEYVRSHYGDTLYEKFFAPYTEKFLRWPLEEVHADWALTGINRSVIDSQISANRAWQLLKSLTLPQRTNTQFLYPAQGGFGAFFEALFRRCQAFPQFHLHLADEIVRLDNEPRTLHFHTRRGHRGQGRKLAWTGNLNRLLELVRGEPAKLPYLNTYFANVIVRQEGIARRRQAQWIYVSGKKGDLSRITCMNQFSPTNCPAGYANLVAEVTEGPHRPLPYSREVLRDRVLTELEEIGFLKKRSCVEAVYVNHVRDTYPIYHRGYKQAFSEATRTVRRFSPHLIPLGRTGAYWYNNSDHSMRMALDVAKALLKGEAGWQDPQSYFGAQTVQPTLSQMSAGSAP